MAGEQELLTDILWHYNIRLGGKWQRDDWVYERLGQYRQEAYRAGQEEMRERAAQYHERQIGLAVNYGKGHKQITRISNMMHEVSAEKIRSLPVNIETADEKGGE